MKGRALGLHIGGSMLALIALWMIRIRCTGAVVPIVYVFLLSSDSCKDYSIPPYIWSSLNQSVNYQPKEFPIVFITDAVACTSTQQAMQMFSGRIELFNASILDSIKSSIFRNNSLIGREEMNLYTTSLLRFFLLEDFMVQRKYNQVFHVESDNLLYFSMEFMLPTLQQFYTQITVTPLNVDGRMTTASVLWVPSVESLSNFTSYIIQLLNTDSDLFLGFREHNFVHSRCYANHERCILKIDGVGLKLYSLNEMTFLAYYQYLYPERMFSFPLLPPIGTNHAAIKGYTINGSRVGVDTLGGIWDSGSWGQYVAGTPPPRAAIMKGHVGSNQHSFVADESIVGFAILNEKCHIKRHCSAHFKFEEHCLTGPAIYCGHHSNHSLTPLWNLHVHSKKTSLFQSHKCECRIPQTVTYD